MTARETAMLIVLGVCLLASSVIPFLATRPLIRWFRDAKRTVRNYRGAKVPLGLGATWLVWAFFVALLLPAAPWLAARMPAAAVPAAVALQFGASIVLPAGVAVVCLAGLADDLFGTATFRGLKGHLKAVGQGEITTGLVKLAVILVMSLWAAGPLLIGDTSVPWATAPGVVSWFSAAVLIAGTANLMNLLDLRPGRALKVSTVVTLLALPALAFSMPRLGGAVPPTPTEVTLVVAVLAIGPMLACLPADLVEASMLGDAGANAAGFVTGLVVAHALNEFTLVTAAVAVVILNLMSELISFSAVIDRTPLLHWLDMMGRRPLDPPPEPPQWPFDD